MAPLPAFSSFWTQMFPPRPNFTDKDLPDLSGKVYLVSGSNTGVRKHLAAMLYSKNAKVYMAARSESKASQAIQDIQARAPPGSVRVVWVSSMGAETNGEKSAGFDPAGPGGLDAFERQPAMIRYSLSKGGNWLARGRVCAAPPPRRRGQHPAQPRGTSRHRAPDYRAHHISAHQWRLYGAFCGPAPPPPPRRSPWTRLGSGSVSCS